MNDAVRIVARQHHDRLGEGLLWSARDDAVYWVDILGRRLSRLSLGSGAIEEWSIPEMIGWVIERRSAPGFIAGLKSGFAVITLDPLRIKPIVSPEPDLPGNRMNDAVADAEGRIWAGTMSMDGSAADGALYRLDPDHIVTRVDRGYRIANGPAISADGAWLYHTDTVPGLVYRFALKGGGTLGPRETFITFEKGWGSPDGMTVDRDGGLWIAHWGGSCISRFTAEGERERVIDLPASQITNCTFAGPALDRMFVSSAADGVDEPQGGALFEVDCGHRGVPTNQFAG